MIKWQRLKNGKESKTAKFKKWIWAKKVEASKTKNSDQSEILFIFGAMKVFTKLRQAFVKALILNYFDLEYHIWIKMDASGYTISEISSQLTLDNLNQ